MPLESRHLKPETPAVRWNKVTLVGVGLLGGSLGLALRQRRLARSVIGFVRRAASVRECEMAGAVDRATRDLIQAVNGADLVVLCTPIAHMLPLVERMLPALKPGAIITDVGSVKAGVVRDLEALISNAGGNFVGSHPMAGAEKMGVAAARADLFLKAICVITPTRMSSPAAVRKVAALWKSAGATVLRLAPQPHDELVSRSSHLPHVVAAALASFVLGPKWPKQQAALCANGFRDTTRIASGSPEMWRDIAVANKKNLARALEQYINHLQDFRFALRNGNQKAISTFFETAKHRRDRWTAKARSASPE